MNSIPLSEEQQKGSLNNLFPHSIALLFSNRHDGNMSFCHGEMASVLANRKIFAKEGIDASGLVCAKQSHGNTVAVVTEADAGKGAFDAESAIPGVDALITNRRKVPLAVFTADCLPVFV